MSGSELLDLKHPSGKLTQTHAAGQGPLLLGSQRVEAGPGGGTGPVGQVRESGVDLTLGGTP